MHNNKRKLKSVTILLCILANFSMLTRAQDKQLTTRLSADSTIYINASTGKNNNDGTKSSPLQTLNEAAKRLNSTKGKGPVTIYISRGVYGLAETVDFNPVNWVFTKEERLTIRAEVLPDDSNWNPADMPVLISTMQFADEKNDKNEITGAQNFGILIQNSHVTIQGLRILGEPVHENPSPGILVRNYPIVWEGKNLEDLRVTQCLFIGNKYAIPNHLGVLANGKNLVVDHCLFYGVKDAVVMWNSPATNSSFHHNIIIDSYGGIVWTWAATDDFKFYNNVISNANVLWLLDKDEKLSYSIENSIIVGYNSLVNKGGGAHGFGEKANPGKIKIYKDVILKKQGKLEMVDDQASKLYLHIKPGTLGSDLGAGLFKK
ncbi:MAG: right-handed parallel beta-helix repeat-containing protein [Bacteroidota bacterium]